MSLIESHFQTITCNGKDCPNTVTYNVKDIKEAVEKNPWMKTVRLIQTIIDGRNFAFCGDECELKAISDGLFNPPEAKKIITMPDEGSALAAMKQAALEAQRAEESTKAMKTGQSVTL